MLCCLSNHGIGGLKIQASLKHRTPFSKERCLVHHCRALTWGDLCVGSLYSACISVSNPLHMETRPNDSQTTKDHSRLQRARGTCVSENCQPVCLRISSIFHLIMSSKRNLFSNGASLFLLLYKKKGGDSFIGNQWDALNSFPYITMKCFLSSEKRIAGCYAF